MKHPLVRINVDNASELAALYGVGPHLAERIVHYREANGYFHGPEDLEKVEGISLALAETLTPHIDWTVVVEPEPHKRHWIPAFFGLAMLVALSHVIVTFYQEHSFFVQPFGLNPKLTAWLNLSILLSMCFSWLAGTSYLFRILASSGKKRRRFSYFGLFFAMLAVTSSVSLGLANTYYYQFIAFDSWSELLEDPAELTAVAAFTGLVAFLTPILLVLWRPKLAASALLNRAGDAAILVLGVIMLVGAWTYRFETPFWVLAIYALWGFFIISGGVVILATGKSFFRFEIDFLLEGHALNRKKPSGEAWLRWINARLPDPEQQKALSAALEVAYPPSRARTALGVLLIGTGGWFLVTVISAIVGWFVEKWMDQLPFFK